MSVLVHWIPTLIGGFLLVIVGFILDAHIRRKERREAERRKMSQTLSPS